MAQTPTVRVVIQEITSASILVDEKDKYLDVGAGLVVYVAFLKGASQESFANIVSSIASLSTQWDAELGKKISLTESGGDVLIVPQASLSGKLKQNSLQFHSLIEKEKGLSLYSQFVDEWKKHVESNSEGKNGKKGTVISGVYGNRQGLKLISSGPYTSQFEF